MDHPSYYTDQTLPLVFSLTITIPSIFNQKMIYIHIAKKMLTNIYGSLTYICFTVD